MTFAQEIILLFTRLPKPGESKTRLIPALGPSGAAELQHTMTLMMSEKICKLAKRYKVQTEVHYNGGTREDMQNWLGDDQTYKRQQEGDIGIKMFAAIRQHLGSHNSILLVGSDCPAIDTDLLQNALEALRHYNIVIGPAFDGGYYLFGTQGNLDAYVLKQLFSDIDWGTEKVLNQTIEKLHTLKLTYHLLKKLHDIDTPEDLRYFHNNSSS